MTKSYKNFFPTKEITKEEKEIIERQVKPQSDSVGLIEPIKWGCKIPYVIDSNIIDTEKIKKALDYVNHTTNYTLVPRTDESNYIKFVIGSNCMTQLGKGVSQINEIINKVVYIYINSTCPIDSIIHEIGHILGLNHEMQRIDRDEYLTVHEDNIENEFKSQYTKDIIINEGEFDYKSLMMYDRYSYSKNNEPTMTYKKQLDYKVGGNYGFSIDDIKTINSKANTMKCPQKSKPPPCNDSDITFFDGDTINAYRGCNTHYQKVNDTLYENDNDNDTKIVVKLIDNIWVIEINDYVLAKSTNNNLFDTKWNIFNISTNKFNLVESAKMTKRNCNWPDLSKFQYKRQFRFFNFLTTNLLTVLIIAILLIIFEMSMDYFNGYSKLITLFPVIIQQNKILQFVGNHYFKLSSAIMILILLVEVLIHFF